MSFDSSAYIEMFYQDAEEHIQSMTDALLDLENNPGDQEALSSVFRAAHSMKSSSAMVGFMHVSEFTHKMEDLIGFYRDSNIQITSQEVTILFKAFDILKEMLGQLQDESSEAKRNLTKKQAKELLCKFEQIRSGISDEQTAHKSPVIRIRMDENLRAMIYEHKLNGEQIYEINVIFDKNCQMVYPRAFLIVTQLTNCGTVLKSEPNIEDDQSCFEFELAMIYASNAHEDKIASIISVSEVDTFVINNVTDHDQFEWIDNKEEESNAIESDFKTESDTSIKTSFDRREDRLKIQTVRVNIDKLDRLLNLTAELVIHRGRTFELTQQLVDRYGKHGYVEDLLEAYVQQGTVLSQLQETITEARMVEIGTVFTKFRRLVRDLAQSRNKKVNLVIEGEETELDKKVIDQLGDPLTHMIRNSLDHGLETPEERIKVGKSPESNLFLKATHRGNAIVVTVEDDGRGIDPEVLRTKAIEKGIISNEEAKKLNTKESYSLILRPGFSTAKEVTDISGRGVGMDVVRRAIEQLGGNIEIESQLGKGTAISLKVPLTLGIIQALLVESNKEIYALPISSIAETIRISNKEIYTIQGKGNVFRLRDIVVPLVNLNNIVSHHFNDNNTNSFYVAVLKHSDNFVGLVVDRMVNEQEVVMKSIDGDISKAKYIAGASILGNGRVILILDTNSLIESTLGSAA